MEISKPLSIQQRSHLQVSEQTLTVQEKILLKLSETLCFRIAKASPEYLTAMSARLSRENFEYVVQALSNLGERPRAEGETALLDLGTILGEIKLLTPHKKTVYEIEAEEMAEERRKAYEAMRNEA